MSTALEKKALKALCGHNLKLLETGEHSDFLVVCGDRTWKTHKFILCRIEYFNKLITSGFKESHENQINIPNFEPFEIDLLLRYIYHPSVAEVARLQEPTQSFLETCVRLWQLGDYYGMETLSQSADEQLWVRTRRHIAEAGHLGDMLKGVPFAPEMEGAIRVAWDPEKAPGPHRSLLLSVCQALGPYLRNCPGIIALFDEIPEFASEFSKAVLGCGATSPMWPRPLSSCLGCGDDTSLWDGHLSDSGIIYHPKGTLGVLDKDLEEDWYCSKSCYQETNPSSVKHNHCEICQGADMSE